MKQPAYFNLMTFSKDNVIITSPKGGSKLLTEKMCKKAKIQRLRNVLRILWNEYKLGLLIGFGDKAKVELTKEEMVEIMRIA